MAYAAIAYRVMACIAMAHIVMARLHGHMHAVRTRHDLRERMERTRITTAACLDGSNILVIGSAFKFF